MEVVRSQVQATLLDPVTGTEERPSVAAGNAIPLSPTGGESWVGLHYDARHPVDLVLFDPTEATKTPASLTGFWGASRWSRESWPRPRTSRGHPLTGSRCRDGCTRTPGRSTGTIVLIHGGPTHHAEDRFNAQVQYLVSRGFDVLTPNYRGSTGFGLWFQETKGGRLGRPRAGGHQVRHRGAHPGRWRSRVAPASPGPRTAGTPRGGRSRTIRRPRRRRGPDLRHDGPRCGLPRHPPRPPPVQRGDDGSPEVPDATASARR